MAPTTDAFSLATTQPASGAAAVLASESRCGVAVRDGNGPAVIGDQRERHYLTLH